MWLHNEEIRRRFKPGSLFVAQTVKANYFTLNRVKSVDSEELFADILLNPVNGESWWVCDMTKTRIYDARGRYVVMAYFDTACTQLTSVTVVDLLTPGLKVKRPIMLESDLGWFVSWRVSRREPLTNWCFSVPDKDAHAKATAYYLTVVEVYESLIRSGQLREG